MDIESQESPTTIRTPKKPWIDILFGPNREKLKLKILGKFYYD